MIDAGTQIGDYRVLSRIGGGAYGEVYRAEHVITQRVDAIKLQIRGRLSDPEHEHRFLREIQVQASLQHPNIAAVYNAFWAAPGLVLVMECVEGEPLSAILARGRVPLETGLNYVRGMLAGLEYAHAHGVIHRDIKPENVVVTSDGTVKLTDFGLARSASSPRLTQKGEMAGSPSYMAPEQVLARVPADARSDIYSTGVVLYEVVTGRPPFQSDTGFTVMMAHQNEAPRPPAETEPALTDALNAAILRALEKSPDARFQTAAEFLVAISPEPAKSAPAPVGVRVRKPKSRKLLAVLMAAMCAIACLAALLLTMRVTAPMKQVPVTFKLPPEPVLPLQPPSPAVEVTPQPVAAQTAVAVAAEPAPVRAAPRKRVRASAAPQTNGIRVTSSEPAAAAAADLPPAPAPVPPPPPVAPVDSRPQAIAQPEGEPPAAGEPEAASAARRGHPIVRALRKVFRR